ncbi:MAG: ATP-dependent DNA helicase [Candidatus Hadarchaeum sp.]|uniref:ATP-dependent DNA helicase n=1 Tax=Candidatus Hadarchaeum sp. TaxID=2883567 RepID=UPI003D152715
MKISEVCDRYGLDARLSLILEQSGISSLYPPQQEAVEKGALDGKNLVMAIPTAAGKTLIAELCMLKSVLGGKGKCLYIVPLRALASEKYEDFKEKYEPLSVKVGISTGDFDYVDPRLANYDILVATSEKVDSLLRHRAKWLADVVAVVVLDEVHLIDDPGRGPTLEVLTARLRQVNPAVQILALSATVKNADEIAEWLGAELVKSEWRPVPLRKGVYFNGKIWFDDGSKLKLDVKMEDDLTALAASTVKEGGQALVFVNTRRSAQAAAALISEKISDSLSAEEKKRLEDVARIAESALGEPSRACRELAGCIRKGVAFHHAGLHHVQRKAVEDAFRKNLIKVVCATPTLAMGVNLPSRRTVIRDYRRYVEPYGQVFIPVLEFYQMAGRAGRPQYDRHGEAVLIAKSKNEVEALFEKFIRAEPERITSKLASEPALRTHVLASIAAGYVSDEAALLAFMSGTFFAHQYGVSDVQRVVQRVLDFLDREGMIKQEEKLLFATEFGRRVSMLYIDPLSAVVLRDGLRGAASKEPTEIGLLHLICHTPDMELLYLRQGDYEELEAFFLEHADELLTEIPDGRSEPERFETLLAELKTARMLQAWINEVREDDIHEMFGVGAGDIRRSADTAKWLLYSAHELSSLFRIKPVMAPLRKLEQRVRHGIREELLELVQLRGIGRVRGRSLFRAGYRRLSDIEMASEQELSRVPYIGPEIARSIKRQVEQKMEPEAPQPEI